MPLAFFEKTEKPLRVLYELVCLLPEVKYIPFYCSFNPYT